LVVIEHDIFLVCSSIPSPVDGEATPTYRSPWGMGNGERENVSVLTPL
jgi:hypothetical protein